jgi:heme/copper-type cytochrome/quinol oxidase subunit 2
MNRAMLLIGLLCVAILIPIVRSDTTILNEQVILNDGNPSKSYQFDLTGGTTISITLTVAGQGLINFHVLDSSDSQLLDAYDVGTEGFQRQWSVPSNGRFEFVIELTLGSSGLQSTVGIKLTSGSGGEQPSDDHGGGTLVDQNVTVTPAANPGDFYTSGKDFYLNLTVGERVSMKVTATGSPINLRIYNSTNRLYEKANFTSLDEEWDAPYNDTYDFWLFSQQGTAQVHIALQDVGTGGGFDPTLLIVIVVIVLVLVIAAVVVLRVRNRSGFPPPPPPPPPPPG